MFSLHRVVVCSGPLDIPDGIVKDRHGIYETAAFTCENGQYNDFATLIFSSQTNGLKHMFSRGTYNEFSVTSLVCFIVVYFFISAYVAGSALSSGLMVPFLLIGAAYGRLVGHVIVEIAPHANIDPGVFALVGAASFFAGVSRMTISLTIIMLEITNDLQFLPPIMLCVLVAKWIADLFCPPLYDLNMHARSLPFLESDANSMMNRLVAADVMSQDIVYVPASATVAQLCHVLTSSAHAGFPVVTSNSTLTLKGLILRKQLMVLLNERVWQRPAHPPPFSNRKFNDLCSKPGYTVTVSYRILPQHVLLLPRCW